MSWNDLFVNMDNTNFFNFSFLPKYGSAFVRGFEYTLLLAVVSVLLAVLPALLLAMLPILILYLFLQRYIVEGVTSGAVKG